MNLLKSKIIYFCMNFLTRGQIYHMMSKWSWFDLMVLLVHYMNILLFMITAIYILNDLDLTLSMTRASSSSVADSSITGETALTSSTILFTGPSFWPLGGSLSGTGFLSPLFSCTLTVGGDLLFCETELLYDFVSLLMVPVDPLLL